MSVKVNREEAIDLKIPLFNNGASPGWNAGSPMIVRKGEDVWFSLSRPVAGVPPYPNTLWQIHKRQEQGWKVILESDGLYEREPCPLVFINPATLALFVNPRVSFRSFRVQNQAELWDSHPHLLAFPAIGENPETVPIEPVFSSKANFREHTYRGIAVNPPTNEILLIVVDPDSELYYSSYLDPEGTWHAGDAFTSPIRGLYPNLSIRNGEGHFVAVSDIQEPVAEWREAKFQVFKRHWDYAYRHIYYSHTPDMKKQGFESFLLIDSIADRPGYARNLDLLVDEDGDVHVLYLKKRFQYVFLRDRFFPGEPMYAEIGYARIEGGKLRQKHAIAEALAEPTSSDGPDDPSIPPGKGDYLNLSWGRLHQLEDGSLVAIYSAETKNGKVMRLVELDKHGRPGPPVNIPMMHPMNSRYFTNTQRGGSTPANKIDLIELSHEGDYNSARYAEIEVIR